MSQKHPCFNVEAHRYFGRMHLPVAPRCNIRCGFCDRRFSCVNESRPGVTASVVSPVEAKELAEEAMRRNPRLSVAAIAGPGDPLANPRETLETLRLIRESLPSLLLCLSTNGLSLPDYADELASIGLSHLTVTVNAVDAAIGARIYMGVSGPRGWLTGPEGAEWLLERQLAGISRVKTLGIRVKVNMVIIPGINDAHVPKAASTLARLGVDLMNCMPLKPIAGTPMGNLPEPCAAFMDAARSRAAKWLPQMRHCRRCRADAAGLLGEKTVLGDFLPASKTEGKSRNN